MTIDPATIRLHRTGHGAPLLLLHGIGLDRHMWDGIGGLADRFPLLTCDLPGHSETPAPTGPYEIADLSEALGAVIRREGIGRPHVVGHDLGGTIAQHLAADDPAVLDRLVLIATTPTFNQDDKAVWRRHAEMARLAGPGAVARLLEPAWFTPGFLARTPPGLAAMRAGFAACSPDGLALACEALAAADLIDLIGEIYAPSLVVTGEQDTLAYREAGDWLAQSIAGGKLAIAPQAAHAIPLEQPNWLAAVLGQFLG